MPYRRYRRGYRTSRYRRYKKTFSKYNTYRNRNAVAQANQIYRLNRRISRIESNTKPEYLEYITSAVGNLISEPTTINAWTKGTNILHVTDGTVTSGTPPGATGFAAKIKDASARVLKIIVWGALERNPGTIPSDTFYEPPFSCAYVRVACVQYLAEKYVDIDPADIFKMGDGPSGYLEPLKKGCGSVGRILKVFNIKISSQDPMTKPFKFIIKPKNKIVRKTYAIDGTLTPSQRMKGGIVLLPISYMETNNDKNNTNYHLTLKAKVIYTDA